MGGVVLNQKFIGASCAALLIALLTACGSNSGQIGGSTGGSGGGTTGGSTGGATTGGTATTDLAIGVINGASFTAGTIQISQSPLAAGGSSGIRVDVVDRNAGNALYTANQISVTFNSTCISQGLATVTTPIVTSTGSAVTTYVARGCSGNDTITATASVNGQNLSASGTINVMPAILGSLRFVSATPSMIGIRGAGQNEVSTVIFQLLDSTGGPVPSAVVNFSLDTSVGGITISSPTGRTDNAGNVQITVSSGTIPTTVRVTASATDTNGTVITSQSSGLVISTGVADQDSFSLSLQRANIDGNNVDGTTTTVTARLADRFNNPVFDGTTVSFTAEGGSIGSNCTTVNGVCSVTFTSQNPRTRNLAAPGTTVYSGNNCGTLPSPPNNAAGCDDHRYTILATAIGEESFTDTNGNGFYDAGEPFGDLAEPFLDANENGNFDAAFETLANGDFNRNGIRDPASGNFTGVLCNSGCDSARSLNVFATQIVVMSSSSAVISIVPSAITIASGGTVLVSVFIMDTAGQNMGAGTTVAATATRGTVTAISPLTLADTIAPGPSEFRFSYTAPATPGNGTFSVNVTSPTGLVTNQTAAITVN